MAECRTHRIQKFNPHGDFLGSIGSFGSGLDQFDMRWGVALDQQGLVYVADWRNDRIQQFTPDGEFQATFGSSDTGPGQFNRPTGVCVDNAGDIYVADWSNDRVQVLAPDGRYITALLGDAGLSKWAAEKLAANPDMIHQRILVQDLTSERHSQNPSAVKVDAQGRIVVVEPPRHRIQVYQKLSSPVLPPR